MLYAMASLVGSETDAMSEDAKIHWPAASDTLGTAVTTGEAFAARV